MPKTRSDLYSEPYTSVPMLIRRICNRLGRSYGLNPFPRAFEHNAQDNNLTRVFDQIFASNYWNSEESRSGTGSETAFARQYGEQLVQLIKQYNIRSMFDAPCGDLIWMREVLAQVDIDYIGGDVSLAVVEDVKSRNPELDVRHFDLTKDAFPKTDVWHCRDCLFHLSFFDIMCVLQNAVKSGSQYALLTSHMCRKTFHRNLDIGSGGFRILDLHQAPFYFPPAEYYLKDYAEGQTFPRTVGLWSMETIEQHLPQCIERLSSYFESKGYCMAANYQAGKGLTHRSPESQAA